MFPVAAQREGKYRFEQHPAADLLPSSDHVAIREGEVELGEARPGVCTVAMTKKAL